VDVNIDYKARDLSVFNYHGFVNLFAWLATTHPVVASPTTLSSPAAERGYLKIIF